ncbi:AMP-dependent synthetase/ligase [Lysinibacillus sp. LZ02]|uniref:AMP-dependent synthetase/ligase n=1 Tax=Lysinibacillus sp. LZ02 TaxID=3420668 RepID=UPI003D3602DE
MVIHKTLPTLLAERAKNEPNAVALRQKHLGIWNEVTWQDYLKNVELLAVTLSYELGFQSGETLAIIGENRPQWLYAQMSAQLLGGISVGIYQESLSDQVEFYLNDCKARIVIVEDQEQVDKLLEIEAKIPLVEHIIYYNKQGLRHYKHHKLIFLDDLMEKGEALLKSNANFYEEQARDLDTHSPAVIAYSAATSGRPKGAVLTHFNLINAAKNLSELEDMKKKDDYFSFLPLSWVNEKVVSTVVPLLIGFVVNFPEKPHTVMVDLREIGPQTLLAPPRVYQSLMSNFEIRMEGASWFKRKVYNLFKKYGDKKAVADANNQILSGIDKLMYFLGDAIIFSAIRDHLGLARLRRAYVAGAALQSDAFHFYHSIGVNLKQTYGGTEVAGIAFVQPDRQIKAGSSGVPIPNTEVKIGEDGAIYMKNNAIFSAYLHEEDQKEVIDGWLCLGDNGYLDEQGHLHILDRKEDIITNTAGEVIYPRLVENELKSSPYIQEAVCLGKDKPYMTAILNIDMNSVGRWADKNRIVYTEYSDLSRNPKVVELIEQQVEQLMSKLPQHNRVKKFSILHKQFTADQGELTRTLKIRRNFVEQKYKALIDGMYSDTQEVSIANSHTESVEEKVSLRVIQLKLKQGVA